MEELFKLAKSVRANAYAPYSDFQVGVAIETESGTTFIGANVENVAYPQGQCAEASAIGAMIAAGERAIKQLVVIADSPVPVTPCGGCRQKLAEFSTPDTKVGFANMDGIVQMVTMQELLPFGFSTAHLEKEGQDGGS